MRLPIVLTIALAVPALAQPSLAREHSRHHVWQQVSHHRLARGAFGAEYAQRTEQREGHGDLDGMIARHAASEGVPEALVHRVVIRESRYHPHVVGAGGAMGLMQIKYSTARAMGYTGSPAGLLDADTNLTYAVRYLAGAYRVAHGNSDRAVTNYARGYHDGAKRERISPYQANVGSRSYASARPVERVVQNEASGFDRQLGAR
jgi:soluble lytic murein transglycosylase-like protein